MGSRCRGSAGHYRIGLQSPRWLHPWRHFEIRSIASIDRASRRDPRRWPNMQFDAGKYLFCASAREQPDANSTSERLSPPSCTHRIGNTGSDLPVNSDSERAGRALL